MPSERVDRDKSGARSSHRRRLNLHRLPLDALKRIRPLRRAERAPVGGTVGLARRTRGRNAAPVGARCICPSLPLRTNADGQPRSHDRKSSRCSDARGRPAGVRGRRHVEQNFSPASQMAKVEAGQELIEGRVTGPCATRAPKKRNLYAWEPSGFTRGISKRSVVRAYQPRPCMRPMRSSLSAAT